MIPLRVLGLDHAVGKPRASGDDPSFFTENLPLYS